MSDLHQRTYNEAGAPAPWLRVYFNGKDITTDPVHTWPLRDQASYLAGWRPDRTGDDPATIPAGE